MRITHHLIASALIQSTLLFSLGFLQLGCSEDSSDDNNNSGGAGNGGGSSNAGSSNGGSSTAGSASGGGSATGGDSSNGGTGGGGAAGLQWYSTCGDPVCGPPRDLGLPACQAGVAEGTTCSTAGEQCDANLQCGASLICASSDPKMSVGGCPISRAKYKRDIAYLSARERADLAQRLLHTPLATYSYKADATNQRQLGFIIEDVEPSPSVYSELDRVNVYGYTSMAVAAIQQQQLELQQLKKELAELKQECRTRRQSPAQH